jgi:hypothetical protein
MKWKPTEYRGYEVSNTGLIRSVGKEKHNKILSQHLNHKGYKVVDLSSPKKEKYKISRMTHRLVAKVFIPNPENKPQVNHKDGNKLNNNVENLEWVTNLENHIHKLANNLVPETHTPKRVGQFDLEGNLIATYSSIYEAGKAINSNQYGVSRAVNGLRKTHKKYVWRYV